MYILAQKTSSTNSMCPGRLQGCKRGLYGLSSWEPLRKPHHHSDRQQETRSEPSQDTVRLDKAGSMATKSNQDVPSGRRPILAKYSYEFNKNSPLGKELGVKQKDRLTFIKVHEGNDSWWLAENADGDIGYVPANYMMFLDEKPSGLPWLQNKQADAGEPISQGNGTYKRYQSSYEHKEIKEIELKQYYCEICEKQLNGPKPYQAHMVSKAHREEVEYRAGES